MSFEWPWTRHNRKRSERESRQRYERLRDEQASRAGLDKSIDEMASAYRDQMGEVANAHAERRVQDRLQQAQAVLDRPRVDFDVEAVPLRIVSDGSPHNTRLYAGDQLVAGCVAASWTTSFDGTAAVIELRNVEIELRANV